MERPTTAALLAVLSGLLDAWSLTQVQSFATVQSGNIVTAGYRLAAGQWPQFAAAIMSIVAFAAGAFLCALAVALLERRGRNYSRVVLGVEAVSLSALAVLAALHAVEPIWIACGLGFLAGAQGNAFHRDRGMLYGNVAVTFVLQAAFSYFARALAVRRYDDGEEHLRPGLVYGGVILAFAGGAAAGFALGTIAAELPLVVAALLAAGIAVPAAAHGPGIDPSQGAPTP
ncbi:DUF1275 family protein [Agromyces seonyuensis]|uniref:DUF1275 domain-containing protein n=1 Tax=Agromyces seonyuensis TaxID=2662446 RepID=A0A6I4NU80_9MICO|nr:YoaK family protein [Agromyces seonyuensis]MWB97840.1 DUF1275 domain-containing protein [Agromyces seonyuensis]